MTAHPRLCEQCGLPVKRRQRRCPRCQADLAEHEKNPLPRNSRRARPRPPDEAAVTWIDCSPILGSNIATRQLALLVLLSLVLMQVLVGVMGWFVNGEFLILPWIVFAAGGGTLVILLLIAVLVLGNSMNTEVAVTAAGLAYRMGARSRGLNRAAIAAGAAAGSPGTAGAGMLAASRETGFFRWSDVARVRIRQRRRSIALYGSKLPLIEVTCPPDLFAEVMELISQHVPNIKVQP